MSVQEKIFKVSEIKDKIKYVYVLDYIEKLPAWILLSKNGGNQYTIYADNKGQQIGYLTSTESLW